MWAERVGNFPSIPLVFYYADMHNSQTNLAPLTWSTASLRAVLRQPCLPFPLTINAQASLYPPLSLSSLACFSSSSFCFRRSTPAYTHTHIHTVQAVFFCFVSGILKDSYLFSGNVKFMTKFSPPVGSPELRKGNVSSLSLSPSGPGAVVPRSNRDVPLPESGKRGNRDCMA